MKRPFLVLVGSVVLSLLSVGASAYDCTSGGEQISITSALFLFGEAPDPNTSQNIVWFEGITSRSPEDAQQCPGWVRIEAWIDGVPGGAVVRQSETWATIGTTNMLDLMHVFVQGSQAITWQGHSKHWFIHDGWFGDPWTHIGDRAPSITSQKWLLVGGLVSTGETRTARSARIKSDSPHPICARGPGRR